MEWAPPLGRMTVADKLRALELLWDDLCQRPEEVPSPAWHADVLQAREHQLAAGQAELLNWNDAKRQLRDHSE